MEEISGPGSSVISNFTWLASFPTAPFKILPNRLYGANRSVEDFRAMYPEDDGSGVPIMDMGCVLTEAGFKFVMHDDLGRKFVDQRSWVHIARAMEKGNASIVIEFNPDNSSHAITATKIRHGKASNEVRMTVADPWTGTFVTKEPNYWKARHVIFVIQRPTKK